MAAKWLSQKAFCADNNIAYHVFHYWYGVYKSEQKPTGSFLPVSISSAVTQEQITISGHSGIQLKVPLTDQSVRCIKQLLLCCMLHLNSSTSYYWYQDITDMRKGFDALCGTVQQHMNSNVLQGGVYIFINRKRNQVKLLTRERKNYLFAGSHSSAQRRPCFIA